MMLKDKNIYLLILVFSFSLVFSSCSLFFRKKNILEKKTITTKVDYLQSSKSQKMMVVTAHPLASSFALDILKKGGNAVDAFVTASFVISVVRPQSTGIGGGGFLLYYDKKRKETKVYDFRERAPLASERDMYVETNTKAKKTNVRHCPGMGENIHNVSINVCIV